MSALVYVDHNLGTAVKDAFVVPEPLQDLSIKVGTLIEAGIDLSLTYGFAGSETRVCC